MTDAVQTRSVFSHLWWFLRQISGDAAYDNYLQAVRRQDSSGHKDEREPLSTREFYADSLRRRYSKISRCC